jgi:FMN reductase
VSRIVAITGSPASPSRTSLIARQVAAKLERQGFAVDAIEVRALPAEDLLFARPESQAVRTALGAIERAQGVVIATPVYKASYTGVLKSLLDLLPQFGLTGKVVLPLATGGTVAHVLAIDYALRPVLASLGALHIVGGLFLHDKLLERTEAGELAIEADLARRLDGVVDEFARAVRRAHPPS